MKVIGIRSGFLLLTCEDKHKPKQLHEFIKGSNIVSLIPDGEGTIILTVTGEIRVKHSQAEILEAIEESYKQARSSRT